MRDVLLIRHGETDWNAQARWQGWTDRPLNAVGTAQAESRARALAAIGISAVELHSSDLIRAHATARILGSALGVEPIPNQAFRERHGGAFEGLNRDEIAMRHPGYLERWHAGHLVSPPGGESDAQVRRRFLGGLGAVARQEDTGATIVIVTHGGVIRVLSRTAHGAPKSVPNLGGRWFQWDGDELHIGAELGMLDG